MFFSNYWCTEKLTGHPKTFFEKSDKWIFVGITTNDRSTIYKFLSNFKQKGNCVQLSFNIFFSVFAAGLEVLGRSNYLENFIIVFW